MTLKQQEQIRQMRSDGEGYKRIAALLNLSVNTVKSFCRRSEEATVQEQPETMDTATCARCHKPIVQTPGRRKRLFCSDACRVAYWRNHAEPKTGTRKCAGCGQILSGNNPHRKYCSHACYIARRFGGTNSRGGKHEQTA